MPALRIALLLLAFLALAACSSVKVTSEVDDATLAALRTYAWHQSPELLRAGRRGVTDPILTARLVPAIERELAAIGMHRAEPDEADVWVTHMLAADRPAAARTPITTMRTARSNHSDDDHDNNDDAEGELMIIFTAPSDRDHPAGGRIAWIGSARTRLRDITTTTRFGSVDFSKTDDDADEHIAQLVRAILNKFPR